MWTSLMHIRAECCLIPWEQTKSKVAEKMIKRTTTSYLWRVYFVHIQYQDFYVLGLNLYVLVQVPYNVLYT